MENVTYELLVVRERILSSWRGERSQPIIFDMHSLLSFIQDTNVQDKILDSNNVDSHQKEKRNQQQIPSIFEVQE